MKAKEEMDDKILSQQEYIKMIVISGFDYTTNLVKPWAEAGYLCYCIDVQHKPGETRDGNIIRVGCDIKDWLPPRDSIAFAAFAPPVLILL